MVLVGWVPLAEKGGVRDARRTRRRLLPPSVAHPGSLGPALSIRGSSAPSRRGFAAAPRTPPLRGRSAPPPPAPLCPCLPPTGDPELFSAPPARPYLLLTNHYKPVEQSIALNDRV